MFFFKHTSGVRTRNTRAHVNDLRETGLGVFEMNLIVGSAVGINIDTENNVKNVKNVREGFFDGVPAVNVVRNPGSERRNR